jgi:hypothetical protein
LGGWS